MLINVRGVHIIEVVSNKLNFTKIEDENVIQHTV